MSSKDEIYARISGLGVGDHACLYYDDTDEKFAVLAPFIRCGLERNERCIYLADPDSAQAIKTALQLDGIDVDHHVKRGALVISTRRDYLVADRFDSDRMIQFLDLALADAMRAGFSALRGTGDMLWEVGTAGELHKLRQYETALDTFFQGKRLTGLCQYHRKIVSAEYLADSLVAHPTAVFNRKVHRKNPYHRSAMAWANWRTGGLPQPKSFDRMCQEIESASSD